MTRKGALLFAAQLLLCLGFGSAAAQVAAPVFVPLDADDSTSFNVTVTSPTPGAEIRYTMNGAEPALTDLPIISGGSILVNRSLTLKAKAWVGSESSPVTTSSYSVTGAISAGEVHSLLLSAGKGLRAAGSQGAGRLGNGAASGNMPSHVQSQYPPSSPISDAIEIAGGMDHSLFIKLNAADGVRSVWSFGDNATGELGNNSSAANHSRAVQVLKSSTVATDFLTGVHEVAAGTGFSLAAHTDESVYSWGTRANGRLGDGLTSGSRKYAERVKRGDVGTFPDLTGIISVRAANGSAFAREPHSKEIPGRAGSVWAWGLNTSGQLGIGSTTSQTRAFQMKDSLGVVLNDVWDVAAGELHTAVVRWRDGAQPINRQVWCVGQQLNGRLGNGSLQSGVVSSFQSLNVVRKLDDGLPLEQITAVAAGAAHTLALDQNKNVWSWGYNTTGALGDSSTTHRSRAVKVKATAPTGNTTTDVLQNIVAISAGGSVTTGWSMALAADGTVYAWGRNANGQHGNGTTTTAAVTRPVAIPNFKLLPGYPEVGLTATVAPPGAPRTVLLTASPTDPDGLGTITNIKIYVNGTVVSDGSSTTHSIVNPTAGSYHAFAIVTDATGIEAQSPPVNFTPNAPEVSLAVQVAPAVAPGRVLFKATPTDADGAGDLSLVKFFVDGAEVGQGVAPNWESAYSPTAPGSFTAYAKVMDRSGLEGTSANVPFSVHAPVIPIAVTSIVHEDPGFVTLTASPMDADGPANLSHVIFYSNGTMISTASGPPWTVEMPSLTSGTYSVSARVYDRFGFQSDSPPLAFTIHNQGGGPDDDGDGITNADETTRGTSPTDSDSDNDGIPDGIDASPLSPDFVSQIASGLSVWAPLP